MKRKPTLVEALLPIVFLIVIIAVGILKYGADPQIPLLMATIVAAALGKYLGYTWSEMEKGIVETILPATQAILIQMIIGVIIGTWIVAGIVPTMIYYGLQIISPGFFLLASTVLCSIVSLATGSSWTTAGTVGIALLGVGEVLGIPTALTAGAIISGAYFGDKLSPLSDTTNLAAAVSGTTLFEHIRNMMKTTIPVYCIALVLYTGIGLRYLGRELNTGEIYKLLHVLEQEFVIHPILLLPPILVILMVALKTPAVPGLTLGGVLGAVFAFIIQHKDFGAILEASQYGYQATTGYELADKLLSRGGLQSMMFTVSLIIVAMAFGGVVEKIKVLETIEERLITFTKTTGSLVLTTVLSCIFCNATLPEQYLSILIPGRMFKDRYRKKGLDPRVLSRILEDSGTMSSALIPWNTCGAFMYATLGVYPFAYLPFAFFNVLSPLIAVISGFLGIGMITLEEEREGE
ncbi:Na+/H+ antiporter NhaC [Fusobacterium necrophorum]|uniref:Na+/H+ antiporter NhaC n=1 Tax=Fusobacterium necrophorum TaxID=859 RepID=UPI0004354ECC|nr:Na+/H+ antiporter NhaC [Fusobacterium necrophorum]EYD69992.1 Na+/H+ antiporter NhaC [Fusobacterium necrophorum subsp. funduliforme B35]